MTPILGGVLWMALGMGWIPFPLLLFTGCTVLFGILWVKKKKKIDHTVFSYMDWYAEQSPLKEVSNGLKFVVALVGIFFCVGATSFWVPLVVLCSMVWYSLCLGKVKPLVYFRFLLVPGTFLVWSSFALLVDFSWHPMGILSFPFFRGYLVMTQQAQKETALVLTKALGAVSSLYGLSLSTPSYGIMGVLKRARVPKIIIELMYLMIRYLYVLSQMLEEMKQAVKSRMGMTGWKNTYVATGYLMTHLLLVSFRRASDCFDAMESRCYTGEIGFLEEEKQVTAKQVIFLVCYGAVLVGIAIVRR